MPARTSRWRGTRQVVGEALLVLLAGSALGFLANCLSPRGLGLAHDFFPNEPKLPVVAITNAASEPPVIAGLKQNGLQWVDAAQARQLFNEPKYLQQQFIFLDARDDSHYQAGHIPGAFQFDHYHPEIYLAGVLSVCQNAEKIVVYCTGGECEDSQFAAVALRDAGVPNQKLFVFTGGITEWNSRHFPVETGAQNSGQLQTQP